MIDMSEVCCLTVVLLFAEIVWYQWLMDEWVSMERWQHDTNGQTKVLWEKLVPLPVCELQILHGQVWKLICGFCSESFELFMPGHG
jgi:hypothetical protein